MFLEIPDGRDPILHVWGSVVPGIGPAAATFSQAVYEHTTLELETFEAARLRVAQLNGCQFCRDWRTDRDGERVADGFDVAVQNWRTDTALGARPRLAAEFAELYVTDHHAIDDTVWQRLRSQFSDAELVELAMSIGSWLAFGRLNRVFGLDTACQLPSPED